MNFNPLVSCIVPVYNADKYLNQCIDSLLTQTYGNIEIILIDDWSTDDSWSICKGYTQNYPNIRVYKNESKSGGPLRGRERGIKEAQGEWVTFIDCDDYVKPKYIENLVKATHDGAYDIAVTGYSKLHTDGAVEDFLWEDYSQTTKERLETFYKHYFVDQDFWTDPADTVGQSLVRASIAKKTDLSNYPNVVIAEDSLMALAFLSNSKNGVNFVDHHDFYWRQVEGSGSHGGFMVNANRTDFYKASCDIFYKNNLLPKISVIVPVYNVERYLKDCVESILAQTYPSLEIILVDDDSLDTSGKIADKLIKSDHRIKVIHKQKNEGLNSARATGFNKSTGEYIMFVDSDDLIGEACVEVGIKSLLKNSADFVRFGVQTFKDKKDIVAEVQQSQNDNEKLLTTKKDLFETSISKGLITVWGAIYTRESVSKINWRETNYRIYEDNIWTLRLLENASSGVYIPNIGYFYRSDDSITNVLSKKTAGNSFNGEPIGYLEFITILADEYEEFNKKYKLGSDEVIAATTNWHWNHRAGNILKLSDWQPEENDKKFVIDLLRWLAEKKTQLEVQVQSNQSRIEALEIELGEKNEELKSFLGIKRSARLLAGNIKRKSGL